VQGVILVTGWVDQWGAISRLKQAGIRHACASIPSPRQGLVDPIRKAHNSRRRSHPQQDVHQGLVEVVRAKAVLVIADEQARARQEAGVQQKETLDEATQAVQALT